MQVTRYAIRIELHNPNTGHDLSHWNCQGSPKDPADFGFAILYASEELANNAIKQLYKKYTGLKNSCRIVPVTCTFEV